MIHIKKQALVVLLFLLISISSFAQGLKIATGVNLQSVVKALDADFTQKTGVAVESAIVQPGSLNAQITNGSSFDLFLSGDMENLQKLYDSGLAATKPIAFASGILIICSTKNLEFNNWERMLLTPAIKKVAIVNPATTFYGKATEQSLTLKGILSEIHSKLIIADNLSQVNADIVSGSADVGFTSQTLIKDMEGKKFLYWKAVDPKSYSPIQQGIVLLKHADGNANALKFYQYILSADAKKIFKEYGYNVD